ncbi:MAG: DNA topoisomerase 4 subunit A [Clostridia bacterium]|nr:DNA topoisomerase 4 subunit A [Clostridia bacterium]
MNEEQMEMSEVTKIFDKPLEEVMHESMMPFAEYVILDRALPRVEDGLKPVQRRILYSMNELGLTPDKPYKKCARIVGECLGKYHPHGDTSVYDALVRLAQDFNMSGILVEGQGNFGSVDGDGAAAMRYTEARLSPLSLELLRDLDKMPAEMFSPNFDDTLKEPQMLPGRFPNLLVNGANGIAVGLATNIPTHNLGEVIDGTVYYIGCLTARKKPDLAEMLKYIKAPDFPTGGELIAENLEEIYKTGRGKLLIRAVFHVEKEGDKKNIVFTEFPYQVNKQSLLRKISENRDAKKPGYEWIADILDESDREGTRAVIKLKRDADVKQMVAMLFKQTDLCKSFGVNMVAIAGGKPKQLGLMEIISYYVDYQKTVIKRRTAYDLAAAKEREEIVRGLLVAINNIDEVVRIIKKAASSTEAKKTLQVRFSLTEKQATAILDMKLRRLCALEVKDLQDELAELVKQIAYLSEILKSDKRQLEVVADELTAIKRKYKTPRRTRIVNSADIVIQENVDPEKIVLNGQVILHENGTMKFVTARSFSTCSKELTAVDGVVRQLVPCTNDMTLFAFTDKGNFARLTVRDLKERKLKEKGFALQKLFAKAQADETVVSVVVVKEEDVENTNIIAYTSDGMVRVTALGEYMTRDDYGAAIKLKDDTVKVLATEIYDEGKDVVLATEKGFVIRTAATGFMVKGRLTLGAGAIRLDDSDKVIAAGLMSDGDTVLCVSKNGKAKVVFLSEVPKTDKMRKGTSVMCDLLTFGRIEKSDSVCAFFGEDDFDSVRMTDIMMADIYDRGCNLISRLGVKITGAAVHHIAVE